MESDFKMDFVKSFLDDSGYECPFDVQLNEHMKRSHFPKSYNCENYVHNLILALCLMVENVKSYNIRDTWYKDIPNFGYKFIFFDCDNNAKVRTIFRSYDGAPRALSVIEFVDILKQKGGVNKFQWTLKEYLIKDKKIIEMKSYNNWISRYPVAKVENVQFTKYEAHPDGDPRIQKHFTLKNRIDKVDYFVKKTGRFHNLISEFYAYYHHEIKFKFLNNECAFHHGVQLAFHTLSNATPEAVHVQTDSNEILFLRYEEKALHVHMIPVILSVATTGISSDKQKIYAKQLCTRSGIFGKALIMTSHTYMGSGGIFCSVENICTNIDWAETDDIGNWFISELDRIYPVNHLVDERDEFRNVFYLSSYIAGLICDGLEDFFHKIVKFQQFHSTQFLHRTKNGKDLLIEINEYTVLLDKVDAVLENETNISVVKVNLYIDNHRMVRRQVVFLPPSPYQHREFTDFGDFAALKWSSITPFINDTNIEQLVYQTINGCFDKDKHFLGSRQEIKAFIDGTFHYYETLQHSSGNAIQKTMAVTEEQKRFHLLTVNFLADGEQQKYFIDDLSLIHKTINIFYEGPLRVCVEDSSLFHIDFDSIEFDC